MLFALVYATTDKTCNKDLSSLTNHDGLIINNQKLPYNNQSHASKFLFLGCCVILDLSINRTPHNTRTAIHRKPTFTDTIIPYSSNHPPQHNLRQSDTYTTDYTHTSYNKKITTRKKTQFTTSYITTPSPSSHTHTPKKNTHPNTG